MENSDYKECKFISFVKEFVCKNTKFCLEPKPLRLDIFERY